MIDYLIHIQISMMKYQTFINACMFMSFSFSHLDIVMYRLFLPISIYLLTFVIEYSEQYTGHFTHFNDGGVGACGQRINAKIQLIILNYLYL